MPVRRLGSTPQQRGSLSGDTCPDIFELDNGDFFVVGKDYVEQDQFPDGASIGDGEWAVVIPRRVLVDAKKDIPDE